MISHLSLPEVVRLTLRRRILNNELAAGERLIEASLAAEFGVSRTTLRSALTELKNDRLVEFSPRRGCWVARMTRAEIDDACFARYLLESGAVCEDRAVIDDRLLAALGTELEAMTRAVDDGDLAEAVECDTRLHGVLIEAGGRARLVELWHALDGQMGALMRSSLEFQGGDLTQVIDRHRSLIEAVATRDRADDRGRAQGPLPRPQDASPRRSPTGKRRGRSIMSTDSAAASINGSAPITDPAVRPPFHLAVPVDDLAKAEAFYGGVLGLPRGPLLDHWIDWNLGGHQIVTHLAPGPRPGPGAHNPVDGHDVPVPHFGLVLPVADFQRLAARLRAAGTTFVIEPYVRFAGEVGEQHTMFFYDPAGNPLEFKAFADLSQLFAH